MYEVHPDNANGWNLYRVGDGGFDLIGVFPEKDDADFCRIAFELKNSSQADADLPVVA